MKRYTLTQSELQAFTLTRILADELARYQMVHPELTRKTINQALNALSHAINDPVKVDQRKEPNGTKV